MRPAPGSLGRRALRRTAAADDLANGYRALGEVCQRLESIVLEDEDDLRLLEVCDGLRHLREQLNDVRFRVLSSGWSRAAGRLR